MACDGTIVGEGICGGGWCRLATKGDAHGLSISNLTPRVKLLIDNLTYADSIVRNAGRIRRRQP